MLNSTPLRQATQHGLVNSEAKGLYKQWTDSLSLLRETTDPIIRKMWMEDLQELQVRAQKLLDSGLLTSTQLSQVKIMLQRPAKDWITLLGHGVIM